MVGGLIVIGIDGLAVGQPFYPKIPAIVIVLSQLIALLGDGLDSICLIIIEVCVALGDHIIDFIVAIAGLLLII